MRSTRSKSETIHDYIGVWLTSPINPRLLFQLIAYTEDERALHLTTGSSVEDCVSSTEHWAANREQIWTALAALETKEELTVCGQHLV